MLTMSDEITTSEHRAAWDTTISAPKSVSLGALVGAMAVSETPTARASTRR